MADVLFCHEGYMDIIHETPFFFFRKPTIRNTGERETRPILRRPTVKHVTLVGKFRCKQLLLWTPPHFEKMCVCNPAVQQCGNLSLTKYVGYGELPFRERYAFCVRDLLKLNHGR